MARVLFGCTAGFGHFLPLVPLARAFADAGHDVAFGAAEVLTAKERQQFRYVVAEDGRTTVLEATPTDRTPGRIALGGLVAFVLGWIIAPLADGTALEWAGVALVFAGFVVGALGLLASGSERTEHGALLRTNRGERWTSLGYPED